MVQLIECPRDAMQGLSNFVPTAQKIEYLQLLMQVGFHSLDFTSFVSPKAIPQMADSHEVAQSLSNWIQNTPSNTRLLAIIANERGAQDALKYDVIDYLGFPFSISETFQQRNTNQSIEKAFEVVTNIQQLCQQANRTLVIYLSMGFGNPYNDPWNLELLAYYAQKMVDLGVTVISLADTVGTAKPEDIQQAFATLTPQFPDVIFGAHFHANAMQRIIKLDAAWNGGCRRFDGAVLGFGGCPFAEDELVGNIDTSALIDFLTQKGITLGLNTDAYQQAVSFATQLFNAPVH